MTLLITVNLEGHGETSVNKHDSHLNWTDGQGQYYTINAQGSYPHLL